MQPISAFMMLSFSPKPNEIRENTYGLLANAYIGQERYVRMKAPLLHHVLDNGLAKGTTTQFLGTCH